VHSVVDSLVVTLQTLRDEAQVIDSLHSFLHRISMPPHNHPRTQRDPN
jgi:hypothetical protein